MSAECPGGQSLPTISAHALVNIGQDVAGLCCHSTLLAPAHQHSVLLHSFFVMMVFQHINLQILIYIPFTLSFCQVHRGKFFGKLEIDSIIMIYLFFWLEEAEKSFSLYHLIRYLHCSCAFITETQLKVAVGNPVSNVHFKARNNYRGHFARLSLSTTWFAQQLVVELKHIYKKSCLFCLSPWHCF